MQEVYLVVGGDLKTVDDIEFKDVAGLEVDGPFATYDEAHDIWNSKARFTVDNAHRRYVILPLHKLLSQYVQG